MKFQNNSSKNTKKSVNSRVANPTDSKPVYFIKSPNKTRRSFAIACYVIESNGKRKYLPFKDERVAGINQQYLNKKVGLNSAKILLNEIIDSLHAKNNSHELILKRQNLSAENQKLLSDFWSEKYEEKLLADERSAKDDFIRAFKLIGEKSLYTASARELTAELKKRCKNSAQHRRAVDRLSEVLRSLKRDVQLSKPPEEFKRVKFLTEDEVHELAKKTVSEELKSLVLTLFGTGARLSEALAFEPRDVGNGDIYIEKQLKPDGTIAPPKRNKRGSAPIIPSTAKAISSWVNVEDKGKYRDSVYDFVFETSRKLWPDNKMKWVSPHDLRHSYAIHCLSRGHSLGIIANSLRNRIEVCQKYYTGFAHNSETLDAAKKMLESSKKYTEKMS